MKHLVIASATLALSAVAAAPASAATIIVTVEGTLSYGSDDYNTLGLGTDLAGQAVSMVFTFDDQTPGADLDNTNAGGQYLRGFGPDYGTGYDFSPGSAVVTIGGVERSIGGDYSSAYETAYDDSDPTAWDNVQTHAGDEKYTIDSDQIVVERTIGYAHGGVGGLDMLSSASLYQSLDLQPGSVPSPWGSFQFESYDYKNNAYTESIYGNLNSYDLAFKVTTLDGPLGAVPEPSTWALTILGFGLVGGAMRRQRRRIALRLA